MSARSRTTGPSPLRTSPTTPVPPTFSWTSQRRPRNRSATFAAVAAGDTGPGTTMLEQGLAAAVPVAIGFLAIFGFTDALFFAASLSKVPTGAYVPLAIAVVLTALTYFWCVATAWPDET